MESRLYPLACTSAYCGRCDCPATCPALPELQAFKRWRAATQAVCADPIWSPRWFTATVKFEMD